MRKIKTCKFLLIVLSFMLTLSVGALFAPTASVTYAESYSVTEMGDHTNGIGKFILGNWSNYGSGSLQDYSLNCELLPEFSAKFLVDGMEIAQYEAENPTVDLVVNRYQNWVLINILKGSLPEYTVCTMKAGCPLPQSGDSEAIVWHDTTDNKDYSLVWADGMWSVPSNELKVATFGEMSAPVVGETYTDVTFNVAFSQEVISTATDNLTGTANNNVRDKIYFDGQKLSELTSDPTGDGISVPGVGAYSRFIVVTLRMRNESFSIEKLERKEVKVESQLKLPNYDNGLLGYGEKGIYKGEAVSRYYVNESKCWIRSYVERANVVFNEENQLFLNTTDVNNLQWVFDGIYYHFPIKFEGDFSVLSEGELSAVRYNQHHTYLYGASVQAGDRTQQSVDNAIGGGYYQSLLDNVKVNGIKLSDASIYGTTRVRVDYYPNYMELIFDGYFNPKYSEIVITLGGGLFFPSGKNMNNRSVDIIYRVGKPPVTNIEVTGVSVNGGYDSIEESKNNPVSVAVNQEFYVGATPIPSDAFISYMTYEIVEQSQEDTIKITKKGKVTAYKSGTVTVKVDALGGDGDGTYKYITYSISEFPLNSISLAKTSETIFVGATLELEVYFSPYNASHKELNYVVSDPTVAKVENGVVYSLKGGKTTITVSSVKNPSISAVFTLTVSKRPVKVEVTKPTKVLYQLGENLDTAGMVVTVTYNDGTVSNIPASLVTVAGYSNQRLGEQYINVIYEGLYDSFVVNVVEKVEKKSGCGSAMGTSSVIAMAMMLLGASIIRKKNN